LVVAYALVGNVNIDFETEPIGVGSDGKNVFLKDIWPSRQVTQQTVNACLKPAMFTEVYGRIA
jgi:aconitate hydratase